MYEGGVPQKCTKRLSRTTVKWVNAENYSYISVWRRVWRVLIMVKSFKESLKNVCGMLPSTGALRYLFNLVNCYGILTNSLGDTPSIAGITSISTNSLM